MVKNSKTDVWLTIAGALGAHPSESLADAAERVVATGSGRTDVAAVLLERVRDAEGRDPWTTLEQVADMVRRPLFIAPAGLTFTLRLSSEEAYAFVSELATSFESDSDVQRLCKRAVQRELRRLGVL